MSWTATLTGHLPSALNAHLAAAVQAANRLQSRRANNFLFPARAPRDSSEPVRAWSSIWIFGPAVRLAITMFAGGGAILRRGERGLYSDLDLGA